MGRYDISNNILMKNVAEKIIEILKGEGIGAYIWCVATSGSVYIRFSDPRMCSIRISDHESIKYSYKYNIRTDINHQYKKWKKDRDIWRLYLGIQRWKNIIPYLIQRNNDIKEWKDNKPKYAYGIPKHKRKNEITLHKK